MPSPSPAPALASRDPETRPPRRRSIEVVRAVAILTIFTYHFTIYWRRAHHAPWAAGTLHGVEWWLAMFGGTLGVSAFVIVSGVGLVATMRRGDGLWRYLRRRALRIFPEFWWIALPAIGVLLMVGKLTVTRTLQAPFWLTGTTLLDPGHLWPAVGPWWFITLIVQVYLLFPLLWLLARRIGPLWLMVGAVVVNVAWAWALARGHITGGRAAADYLGMACVLSRLVELTAGLCLGLAYWGRERSERPSAQLLVATLVIAPAGLLALRHVALLWTPLIWAYLFVALMLAPPIAALVDSRRGARVATPLVWIGGISYAFFLTHTLVLPPVIGWAQRAELDAPLAVAVGLAAALALAALCRWSFAAVERAARAQWRGSPRQYSQPLREPM